MIVDRWPTKRNYERASRMAVGAEPADDPHRPAKMIDLVAPVGAVTEKIPGLIRVGGNGEGNFVRFAVLQLVRRQPVESGRSDHPDSPVGIAQHVYPGPGPSRLEGSTGYQAIVSAIELSPAQDAGIDPEHIDTAGLVAAPRIATEKPRPTSDVATLEFQIGRQRQIRLSVCPKPAQREGRLTLGVAETTFVMIWPNLLIDTYRAVMGLE